MILAKGNLLKIYPPIAGGERIILIFHGFLKPKAVDLGPLVDKKQLGQNTRA